MKIVLLTPPMTQVNTPYPATPYLYGFLKDKGYEVYQRDPSILLFLKLFSNQGLTDIHHELQKKKGIKSASVDFFLKKHEKYKHTIRDVVLFLQGKAPQVESKILKKGYLPFGPRFKVLKELEAQFGESIEEIVSLFGYSNPAKFFASLYLDDLNDVIHDGIDARFELSKYGEKLAASAPSFDPILNALRKSNTLVDRYIDAIASDIQKELRPDVVGITLPFPGNVYAGFRMAQQIKTQSPDCKILMGGGYVNTELRNLKDVRVFDFVDYFTLDDGEKPLLCLLENFSQKVSPPKFLRTLVKEADSVVLKNSSDVKDFKFNETSCPSYEGLPLSDYLSLSETLNPMHRLWSERRWNKLTVAHGCYWKKCTFCDLSLDYISRYEALDVEILVDRIERLVEETGERGFHFVDEAAPPKVLKLMAERLIDRKIEITWWANIRFEKAFTRELTDLLARSGCIAMSGGLEVATDRLLKLMDKGVTVDQVTQVTKAFSESGIMVHAYLMYGFPTETPRETLYALDEVRKLFKQGYIQSAFWHRFSVTAHSPIGKNPERYGIRLYPEKSTFAVNDIPFVDSTGVDHSEFQFGLKKAVYNYMYGVGLDEDVRSWFS